jgi:hypothetical protein
MLKRGPVETFRTVWKGRKAESTGTRTKGEDGGQIQLHLRSCQSGPRPARNESRVDKRSGTQRVPSERTGTERGMMAVRLCSCQSYQKYCQTFRAWITSTRRCDTRSERCGLPSDGLETGKWKKRSVSVAPSEAYATKSDKEANESWMARYRELKMGTRISDWRTERRRPTSSKRCRMQRRSRGKGSKPKTALIRWLLSRVYGLMNFESVQMAQSAVGFWKAGLRQHGWSPSGTTSLTASAASREYVEARPALRCP